MNEDIEKLNAENKRQNEAVSPGNQSRAAFSNITTPEEDNKRSIAEGIIQDLGNQRIDIDATKLAIQQIAAQINQITQALNQLVPNATPQTPEQGKINMETISLIGDLFEKGASAWKSIKGGDSTVDSFTQTIVDRSKQEAMQSLDIVSLINQKVKKTLVNDIAGDLAGHIIKDSPEKSHEPQ